MENILQFFLNDGNNLLSKKENYIKLCKKYDNLIIGFKKKYPFYKK